MSINKMTMSVQGTAITVLSQEGEGYISLTDMVKAKDDDFFIADQIAIRQMRTLTAAPTHALPGTKDEQP